MRTALRHVLPAVLVTSALAALPPASGAPAAWALTAAIAALGGVLLAAFVATRYLAPLQTLAGALRERPDAHRTSDLAMFVASEHRQAIGRIDALKTAERRHRAALGHTSDGVIVVDGEGAVEYANPVARWLVGDRALDATRRLNQPDLIRVVRAAVGGDAPVMEDLLLRVPETRHVLVRAVPLEDGSCILLFQDRTEADRVDRVRRDFVANVSHELKTPVAGIRALADVAAAAMDDADADAASNFIGRLAQEADRLGRLVLDLLDLSRVEAGADIEMEDIHVRSVLEAAVERARPVADARSVTFGIDGHDVTIRADLAQLTMAVQNLVDNAVRYSDGGAVRLAVARGDGSVTIAVSDEGIGIPQDQIPRIFERFYRVDRARSRATGGTGLGLAIVRHVAENHSGRVEVISELGAGSTFILHLPDGASVTEGSAA